MSYGVTAYRINSKKLLNIFGTKDEKTVSIATKAALNLHCQNIEIAKELIEKGQATQNSMGHEYLYAIEGVLAHLGTVIYTQNWYPVDSNTFGLLEQDFEYFTKLFTFSVPEPDDFPWVLSLKNKDMTPELLIRLEAKINDGALFEELKSWIETAQNDQEDLILYYY